MCNLLKNKPHYRILLLMALGLFLSAFNHIEALGVMAVCAFLLLLSTKNPKAHYALWLKINAIMLSVWLTLPWKIMIEPHWHIHFYAHGFLLAMLITLKFNIIFCVTRLLFDDFKKIEIIQAFSALKLPKKLLLLTVLMLNYVDVFIDLKKNSKLR